MDSSARFVLVCALLAGLGATLLLSNVRWFRRSSLTDRLTPFSGARFGGLLPSTSLTDLLLPSVAIIGQRLASVLGVTEDLGARLARAGFALDTQAFRMRQVGASAVGLAIGLVAIAALQPPLVFMPLLILAPPLLGFLLLEQQVVAAGQARQHRIFAELPVMSEQLAMLLSAGYSVGAALARISERNSGTTGKDLKQVCERVRHGLSIAQALNEWSSVVNLPELGRLVSVLSLSSETSDLGSLVSAEANSIRREAQRQMNEVMDRRGQQVWIPVTVATLIPGVIFLIIPFLQALHLFSGT